MPPAYEESVFINCPFDDDYAPLFRAIVFAVHDCGFVARCAQELPDSGPARINRIVAIIRQCRFGIHDISRTELDKATGLPRFNMPLELGLFLGAREFGDAPHNDKVCLVLDRERYRFATFCSDIGGQDPVTHDGDPARAIRVVRDWLRGHSNAVIPGGARMAAKYERFRAALPALCDEASLDYDDLTFVDYAALVVAWLQRENLPLVSVSSTGKPPARGVAA